MIRQYAQEYWWIGAVFSVLYTLASVAWTVKVEQRLRKLGAEQRTQGNLQRWAGADASRAAMLAGFSSKKIDRIVSLGAQLEKDVEALTRQVFPDGSRHNRQKKEVP